MQKKYPDQLVAISWNLDHDQEESEPSESLQASVLEKLIAIDLHCENVISSDPIDSVLAHYGIFALPAVLVYGPDGTLVKKFEGDFTYDDDVSPFVAGLLGQ